jgi:hypothetical protein
MGHGRADTLAKSVPELRRGPRAGLEPGQANELEKKSKNRDAFRSGGSGCKGYIRPGAVSVGRIAANRPVV